MFSTFYIEIFRIVSENYDYHHIRWSKLEDDVKSRVTHVIIKLNIKCTFSSYLRRVELFNDLIDGQYIFIEKLK
ncbi:MULTISPECIES: hypothetical protein [Clostridium]|jgi:hypothetical protein|uniref:Uncharacterized protein n=1 Tax=bioreactor metagenome TaxID=1076179 RepID=A0A645GZW5_9ZZZZ|nr:MULTISPECIES: hypothetical protein [Clostridium]MDU1566163.1 hypothetical protein [Clostridium sp.]MDU2157525.1 hypothetical protein [Clostridium sp.]MDU2460436.1 hypothetical protein [Clostridium sp.]MDU3349643.1 hypothetical protein [Clostridium sp.]MDU3406276.1 hypothetical protein [Clostridium sp.]